MADAGSIWVKLGLDSANLEAGLARAKAGLTQWRDETNKSSQEMLKWGAAITATTGPLLAVSYILINNIEQYGRAADALGDLSYQTGISTEQLQRMQYAALISGTEVSTLSFALNKLTISMSSARDPASQTAKAFREIGVTTTGKTTDQVFNDTAKALVGMEDETKRNAVALELFGRSYKEILPLMETYVKNADEIRKHPVYTEAERKQLEDSKVEWEKFTDTISISTGKILSNFEKLSDGARNVSKIFNPLSFGYNALTGGYGSVEGAYSKPFLSQPGSDSDPTTIRLTDRYKGMTDAQIEVTKAYDDMIEAQKIYDEALQGTDQKALDVASRNLQALKNKYSELLAEMYKVPEAAKAASIAWASSVFVGSAGSEMESFMMREMEAGRSYQEALNNYAAGTPTNTRGEGTLGAAQKSDKSSIGKTSTSKSSGISSQSSAISDDQSKIQSIYTESYSKIETLTLDHWTALAEIARTGMQNIDDNWTQTANDITAKVAYENIVTATNGVPDAAPVTVNYANIALATADFSGIKLSAGGQNGGGNSGSSSGGTVTVKQDVTIVSPQGTPAQNAAALKKANQNLGSLLSSKLN